MKLKIILCLIVLILVALVGFNDLIARQKKPEASFGHPWEDSNNTPSYTKPAPPKNVLVFLSSKCPFVLIYFVNTPPASYQGAQNEKGIPKSYKGKENVGASKNLRRKDPGEVMQR